jgi:peptidyl-prolyl cis-trans isomerase C
MLWTSSVEFAIAGVLMKRAFVALSVALVLSSCQHKASGQTVAVVNGEEITASELNTALQGANLPTGMSNEDARKRVLQDLVERHLIVQQARKAGIDKTPEFVTQQQQLIDNLLIKLLISRKLNTAELPSTGEISQYEASHPQDFAKRETWTVQQLLFVSPKSEAVTKQIQATKSLDDIATVLSENHLQFTKSTTQVDSGAFPAEAYRQILALPAGEPFVIASGERSVASVITDRQPNPRSGDGARAFAINQMRQEKAQQLIQDEVKSAKQGAKVTYQPGFGPPAQK